MNKSYKRVALVTATVMGLFSTVALSADPMLSAGGYTREFNKMGMMKMVDANGDHMVTREEYDKFNNAIFDSLDTDKDGSLDAKEWVGSKGEKMDSSLATGGYLRQLRKMKMMEAMDTDQDHKVTREEFLKYQDTIFSAKDKSGDKQLDPQEWFS